MKDVTLENTTAVRSNRWYRRHWLATSFIVAVLALLAVTILLAPERMEPDELVDRFGAYSSPDEFQRVRISESGDHIVRVQMLRPRKRFRFVTMYEEYFTAEFEPSREWFLCFDDCDRLWLFVGRWDQGWGPPHSSWSREQSVLRVDPGRWEVVSTTGNWAGAPSEFFNRIPSKGAAVWGNIPPIPAAPPELPQAQRREATWWHAR